MRHLIPNSTQIPDVILDHWMGKLSGAEFKVVMYIARRTYGFGREGDTISLKQISTGLVTRDGRRLDNGAGLNKDTVVKALAQLEKLGIILREQRRHEEFGDLSNYYRLNLDCEDWWETENNSSPLSENPTGGGEKNTLPRVGFSDTPVSDFRPTRVGKSDTNIEKQSLEKQTRETAAVLTAKPKPQGMVKAPAAAFDFEEGKEITPEGLVLSEELIRAGLNRVDAKRLAATSPEECRRQLDYLPFKTDLKNPGAYLRQAIEGSYGPPASYHEARKQETEAQKKRALAESQAAKKAEAERRAEEAAAALDREIEEMREKDPQSFVSFEEFIEAERSRVVSRLPSVRLQDTMNREFGKVEKRRELYQKWRTVP